MRLRLGRPDIARYSDRFDVPAAEAGSLSVTWLGVATLLLDDGSCALMTDGYFSRPGLARVAAGKLSPSPTLVHHLPSGQRLLIQGSAGYVEGALAGHRADAVYLSVGQLGLRPRSYLDDYWTETVRAVGARRVVLIHWDDFFRPLSKPLRALPYAGDDLDVSIRVLDELAARDGVGLHMPTVWRREDPWAQTV